MWRVTPLGELCDVLDSKRKPITKRDRKLGEYRYYGATGILDYVEDYIFDEKLVLIGEDGAKWGAGDNTAFIVEGKYWVNNHAHVIRPKRDVVMDEWITYHLNALDLSPFVTGLTVPKLNQGKLKEIPLPLPPLPEQQRIVAILDEAFEGIDAAIANTQANLASARELFESYLNRVFAEKGEGWVERKLGEVAIDTLIGVVKSKCEQAPHLPYFYLKMNNIGNNNTLNLSNMTCVAATSSEIEKFSLQDGDFLFNTRNSHELVGKSCIFFSTDNRPIIFNNNIMRIRFDGAVNPALIAYAFSSLSVKEQLEKIKSGTTNVSAIYFKNFKGITVPIPPAKKAIKIASQMRELDVAMQQLEAIYQKKLDALFELKQSILAKAFRGELTNTELAA